MTETSLDALYERPGFLIRRAHQIASWVFLDSTSELNITTTQFGLLFLVQKMPGVEQALAAPLLGLDRSTTAMVLRMLEESGYILRESGDDKRKRYLRLTESGAALWKQLQEPAQRAVSTLLEPLTSEERELFVDLLKKLTGAFNEAVRVPLRSDLIK